MKFEEDNFVQNMYSIKLARTIRNRNEKEERIRENKIIVVVKIKYHVVYKMSTNKISPHKKI